MHIKFYGTYNELAKIIANSGYLGAWYQQAPEDRPTFRFNNGAILNWWIKTGTIQFQGKREAREEVIEVFIPLLFRKPK